MENSTEKPMEKWYFTFGFSHTHPLTGRSLVGRYVVLHGSVSVTRLEMIRRFGSRWSFQYPALNCDEGYCVEGHRCAGGKRFNLTELELTD